ncbi:probable nuclear receptor corepressor 1 at N-terminal half [Coccomyxa sp. Obi]|nr:probable nuclear receptor corepressor 1 at N-terminal half [Coccomyxa sp. Obi]
MGSHEDGRRWERADPPPGGPYNRPDRFAKKRDWPGPVNGFERDHGPPPYGGAGKRSRYDPHMPPYFQGPPRDAERGPPGRPGFAPRRSPPPYRSPPRRPLGGPAYPPGIEPRGRGSPTPVDTRGFDRGVLPPPPPSASHNRVSGWESRPGSREGWRGRGARLPPPPMRRQHSAGRDGLDYEAGEFAEPPLARGGWDQKPGPGPSGGREGRYGGGGGISRTASLPPGRAPPPEALPMAPDFPGPPPLHRSISHPIMRPVSPLQRPMNGPLANGGSAVEVSRGPLVEEQHHRSSSSFPVAYTPLPHHLVSQPSHSMPPGIMTRRAEVPSPPVPPLLASPALPDFAQPAADSGAPSPALRPMDFALPGSATPGRQQPPQQPADAEPEAGELSTPAGSVAGEANATPVSDDPPKRKRLGWGQGLARLRSVDKRGLLDDHSEQHSPRDSEASRHTDAARDSPALHSPSFSVRTDDAAGPAASPADALTPAGRDGPAAADQPLGSAVPEPPALLMVEPAVVIEAPADAAAAAAAAPTPPPLLQAMGEAVAPIKGEEPPEAAALASPPQLQERPAPALATPSPGALAAAAGSIPEQPLAADALVAIKEPTPVNQEAAAPVPPEPASAAAELEAKQQPPPPSKEVIMRRIDSADGAIEALERRVAELSAALDEDAAAEQHLAEDIAHLESAPPMEVAPSEGDSSMAPSSQSHPGAGADVDMEAAEPAAVSREVCKPLVKKAKALDRARAHISATKAVASMKGPLLPTGELDEGDRLLLRLPRRWQVEAMVKRNHELAAKSRAAFLPLLHEDMLEQPAHTPTNGLHAPTIKASYFSTVMYTLVEEAGVYHHNLKTHQRLFEVLLEAVRARRLAVKRKEVALGRQYQDLYEQWRTHLTGKLGLGKKDRPSGGLARAASSRKTARSDYEQAQIVLQLQAVERMKEMVQVPPQILCPYERAAQRYICHNARVDDPVEYLRQERQIRPWTPEEKRIFNEKFLQHPKDFRRIAMYLDGRTTGDCVMHYYRVQKLDEFAAVRRKQQLKKRRQQSEVNRSITYLGIGSAAKRGDPLAAHHAGYGRLSAAAVSAQAEQLAPRGSRGPRGGGRGAGRGAGRGSRLGGAPPVPAAAAATAAASEADAVGITRGDEDWTPADEGGMTDAGKKLGRGGESSSWSHAEEKLFVEGVQLFGLDFGAIRRHMGQSRTIGAVKSFFSKNRRRLDLDRIAEDANAKMAASEMTDAALQQLAAPLARRPPSRGPTPVAEARLPAPVDAARHAAAVARVSGGSDGGGFGAIGAAGGDADMADAADMLNSLQALSAAGGHGPGAPLGPPPPLGLLQHLAAQGMGDAGGMHGAFPPNLPPQLASLMQAQAQQQQPPPPNPMQALHFMQQMGLPPHVLHMLVHQMATAGGAPPGMGGPPPAPGGLPPGFNPALLMPGVMPGLHPLNMNLQNYAIFQALQGGGGMTSMSAAMHSAAADRQLPLPGQLPLGSGGFQAADERAFQFQQQLQQQMGVQQQLDSLQAMSELREAQLKSSRPISPPRTAGLEGIGQEPKQDVRWSFDSSLPQRGEGESAQQLPGGPGGLPQPFVSITGAPPRSDGHMKRSTSADSLPVFCAAPVDEPQVPDSVVAKRQMSLWTEKEKAAFMEAYKLHGRNWARLSEAVPSKTLTQIKNYYQNYKVKLGLDRMELPTSAVQPVSRKRARADAADSPAASGTPCPTPPAAPAASAQADLAVAALERLQVPVFLTLSHPQHADSSLYTLLNWKAPAAPAASATTQADLAVAALERLQGQQPERPFSTPPSGSAEATEAVAAVELARQLSQSAPPPGSYSDRLPDTVPVHSHEERGPSPSATSAAAAEVAEVIKGQPLVPGPAQRAVGKSMPHQSLPALLAREEIKPGHGGSLGGPRMQQQLLRGGVQASRLGGPGGPPGVPPLSSTSKQPSREASPLLGGLEEVRRELEAMRAIEASSQDLARHPREVGSGKWAGGQEDAQRTTSLPREALAASEDLNGRMARFLQQQQHRTPSGSGGQSPREFQAAQFGGNSIADLPRPLSEGNFASSPHTRGQVSSTPLLLEALRSMGKMSSTAQPAQQALIPPALPLANASPPPPAAWPPSTEAVKAMLAAAAAAAASAAAGSAAGPAQPSVAASAATTSAAGPAQPTALQPPFPVAAPQPNAFLTAESHRAAAPGAGSATGHDADPVADEAQPKEQSQRAAVPMDAEPAVPDALASVAAGNEPDGPLQQPGALEGSLRSASPKQPAQFLEHILPEPQLPSREQAAALSPADQAFETTPAHAEIVGDAVQGAKGELSVQQPEGSKQNDELPAATSEPPQAAEGVSLLIAPADVAPAPEQAALVDPTGADTASLAKLSSIPREAAEAVESEQQEMASVMDATDGAAA